MRKSFLFAGVAAAVLIAGAAAYRHFVLVQPLKDRLLSEMRDPASAQFRDVRLTSGWTHATSSLCGEVNVKNGMGGYVGFQFFTVSQAASYIEDSEAKQLLQAKGLNVQCKADDSDPWWWLTS